MQYRKDYKKRQKKNDVAELSDKNSMEDVDNNNFEAEKGEMVGAEQSEMGEFVEEKYSVEENGTAEGNEVVKKRN